MINYIKVFPRAEISNILKKIPLSLSTILFNDFKTPWALISLYGLKDRGYHDYDTNHNVLITADNVSILKELGCVSYHNSCFMDITKEQYDKHHRNIYMEGMLFDEERARNIVEFVDKIRDSAERLIIHCDAGISRSSATGLWATRYLGLDEMKFWNNNNHIRPNPYVFKILCNVSGITNTTFIP
jgi:hypothetical protein